MMEFTFSRGREIMAVVQAEDLEQAVTIFHRKTNGQYKGKMEFIEVIPGHLKGGR